MPSNETVKIKSGPKHLRRVWRGVGLFLLLGTITTIVVITRPPPEEATAATYTLQVSSTPEQDSGLASKSATSSQARTYYLTAAISSAQQQKGLSDTDSLEANHGMIFIADVVAERCFWMKDMHYPLDIIWVDSEKKVVHIEKNLSPDTYPRTYCADAKYTIELNAGEADKSRIRQGQVLSF